MCHQRGAGQQPAVSLLEVLEEDVAVDNVVNGPRGEGGGGHFVISCQPFLDLEYSKFLYDNLSLVQTHLRHGEGDEPLLMSKVC